MRSPSRVHRYLLGMERPVRFEHTRWLGDKRTQVVYDLDTFEDEAVIEELMAAQAFLCFDPDTLAEARNRGYRLAKGHPRPAAVE
jgi:hypothetical protein